MHQGGLTELAINGVIRRKVNDWLSTVTDEDLRKYLQDKIIVAGGSLASLNMGEKVNDFDVYFTTREAAFRVACYYTKLFVANPIKQYSLAQTCIFVDDGHGTRSVKDSDGKPRVRIIIKSVGAASLDGDKADYQYFESVPDPNASKSYLDAIVPPASELDESERMDVAMADAMDSIDPASAEHRLMADLAATVETEQAPPKLLGAGAKNKYRPVFLSGNAITLSDKMQLIIRFYGEPEEILKNFDFVHTHGFWTSSPGADGVRGGRVVISAATRASQQSRTLHYTGSRYPLCSLIRVRKFAARGWTCPAPSIVSAAIQFAILYEKDKSNPAMWEDQMTGVDVAYFKQIVDLLHKAKDDGTALDGSYVLALMDKLV